MSRRDEEQPRTLAEMEEIDRHEEMLGALSSQVLGRTNDVRESDRALAYVLGRLRWHIASTEAGRQLWAQAWAEAEAGIESERARDEAYGIERPAAEVIDHECVVCGGPIAGDRLMCESCTKNAEADR